MEYYNNILCVEAGWLIAEGILTKPNYDKMVRKNILRKLRNACLNTPALIAYDTIPQRFKDLIIAKLGNDPRNLVQRNVFETYIKPDIKAADFYSKHVLENGKPLPPDVQIEYTTNACVLNAINELVNDRKAMRRAMGGKMAGIWESISDAVNKLDTKWNHSLPRNYRNLQNKFNEYAEQGYAALIHRNFANNNSRKVTGDIERLVMSIFIQKNKPYYLDVHEHYLRFLSGMDMIADIETGEIFDRKMFYNDKKGKYLELSAGTIYNILNNPKNAALLDRDRSTKHDFNSETRPHHVRVASKYSLSKVTMDDRDLPRKMKDGNRVKAYYAYDATSTALIGYSHSRKKNVKLVTDCFRNMFQFLEKNGMGFPLEVEVEHHLMNKFEDTLLKVGEIFRFVRFCNPGNSQEKYAESLIKAKKYGTEKKTQTGIGRPFAKLDSNRVRTEKVFDEDNNNYKEKTYDYNELIADDIASITSYNNDLHPDQKRFAGLTRLEVFKKFENPQTAKYNKPLLAKFIGEWTDTSIQRNMYCVVKSGKYMLPEPEVLKKLLPNNYKVQAYWFYDTSETEGEKGVINEVYIYQNGEYICTAEKIKGYNRAKAEWTADDEQEYTKQSKYVAQFDEMVKKGRAAKVEIVENKKIEKMVNTEAVIAVEAEIETTNIDTWHKEEYVFDTEHAFESI